MSQLQERIDQFRKMASDDPDNELGHFRLGQLLQEGEQYDDAAASFRRTLELSPTFSKAYQLLAACLIKRDQKTEAIEVLTNGWKNADERGDRMPKDAMADMLRQLGASVPEAQKVVEDDGPATGFHCVRPGCAAGKRAVPLASPPVPDAIGQRILREICAECWNDWLKNQSIKVINELRIDLSTEFGQEEYDKYMQGYFGFDEEMKVHL